MAHGAADDGRLLEALRAGEGAAFVSLLECYQASLLRFARIYVADPQETRDLIGEVVASLPPNQREVITLRDIEGWSSDEVCDVLRIGETNQRVLLHRTRSRVRRSLERYLDDGEGATR